LGSNIRKIQQASPKRNRYSRDYLRERLRRLHIRNIGQDNLNLAVLCGGVSRCHNALLQARDL